MFIISESSLASTASSQISWKLNPTPSLSVTPILLSPVAGILLWSTRKAKKEGPQLAPSTLPNVFREPRRAAVAIFHFLDVLLLRPR